MLGQRDYLPAFGPETNVAFHELPDYNFLVGEQLGIAAELLSDQSGGSSVVYNRSQSESKLVRQVLHEACRAGFILTIDAKETVSQDKDFGIWIVLVRLVGCAVDDLCAVDLLRLEMSFYLRHPNHSENIPMPLYRRRLQRIFSTSFLDPSQINDAFGNGLCCKPHTIR